ncbi:hypothetical protein KY343_04235 [Candidatus Woesearchaeota archaeon]|nr:hypothetical protein [Candidatus Woesearchaeota archaeon]
MEKQYTRKEIEHWVDRVTAEMNIDPHRKLIQDIIPHEVLNRCNDNDIVEVAADKGCIIYRCYMDGVNFRANGKWVKPEGIGLSTYKNLSKGLCPECESELMAKIEAGETGFLF